MLSRPAITSTIDQILFQTDLPELLLARDTVGTSYLCSLVKADTKGLSFLAVAISGTRLASLRKGSIDLKEALINPEIPEQFAGFVLASSRSIRFECIEDVPEEWLPEGGLFLNTLEYSIDDQEIAEQASAKKSAVIVFRLNPSESLGTTAKIDADRLASCCRGFQSLVRQAVKPKPQPKSAAKQKKQHVPALSDTLQVFAFSPGSFKIHFESKGESNLFGLSDVGFAMTRIDELMALTSLPADQAIEGLKGHRGHLVGAYHTLMKFVRDQGGAISYRWADPGSDKVSGQKVSEIAAASMCTILENRKELSSEPFNFDGVFTTIQKTTEPYQWIATNTDGKKMKGFVHEDAENVLAGAVIETRSYHCECDERIQERPNGTPVPTLYLKKITELKK